MFSAVGLFLGLKSKISYEQNVMYFQFYIRLPNCRLLGSIIFKKYPIRSIPSSILYRLFFETQGRKYGHILSWSCFLPVADAFRCGSRQVLIRSVNTDVVIAVAAFKEIKAAFGAGTNFRYIAIHEIVTSLNLRMCASLPFFHTFTGYHSVSSFAGRGKRTECETWNIYLDVTHAFEELLQIPDQVSDNSMALIERFVVLMYTKTSEIDEVNEARKQIFTLKSRSLENIPPTLAALVQHIKRTNY